MHGNLSPFNLLIGKERANLSSGESLRSQGNTRAKGKVEGRSGAAPPPSQEDSNRTRICSGWTGKTHIFELRDKDALWGTDVRVC